MSPIELELLKRRIIDRYDPDYLVDVLGLTTEQLVTVFEDRLSVEQFPELDDDEEGEDEES